MSLILTTQTLTDFITLQRLGGKTEHNEILPTLLGSGP